VLLNCGQQEFFGDASLLPYRRPRIHRVLEYYNGHGSKITGRTPKYLRCIPPNGTDIDHPIPKLDEGSSTRIDSDRALASYEGNIPFDWNIHVGDIM
jgi:hypothetical protein